MTRVGIIKQLKQEYPQYEITFMGRKETDIFEGGKVWVDEVKIYAPDINTGVTVGFSDDLREKIKPSAITACGKVCSKAIESKR